MPSFIVVAGMHRSGTSMVAGILSTLGVDLGRRLVPPDRSNRRGYFEDADVVEFHGRMFRALLPEGAPGHVDWGWSEGHALDPAALERFATEARELVGPMAAGGPPRGFKDPRATLTLDLWDACLPEARYVLVYRFPWEVADSMQRLGEAVFTDNPAYGYRIWAHYNERLLAFRARHPERCLLVSSNAVRRDPLAFQHLLESRLGFSPVDGDAAGSVDDELFTGSAPDDRRGSLTETAYPECLRLLEELEAAADLPARGTWRAERMSPYSPARPDEVTTTVVVPVHDDGVFLLDALASLEACLDGTTEVVVVDDGSTDPETLRILQAIERRGYLVVHQPNRGLSAARNTGIARGRGRYVLPLDADNRLRGGFLAHAVRVLEERPEVGIVYGNRNLFGARRGKVEVPEFDLTRMRGGNYIDACAVYRRAVWEDLGGYDAEMTGLEDWEFWLHAARRGWRFQRLSEVAFDYRVRPGSLTEVCLSPTVRRRLLRRLLFRHGSLFDEGTPRWFRIASSLTARVVGRAQAAALQRIERRLFWMTLWLLVGPGGLVAADRRRLSENSP